MGFGYVIVVRSVDVLRVIICRMTQALKSQTLQRSSEANLETLGIVANNTSMSAGASRTFTRFSSKVVILLVTAITPKDFSIVLKGFRCHCFSF